jgi:Haem-binding domain
MKLIKKISAILIVLLIVMQFFRPTKNINGSTAAFNNDISKVLNVPANVQLMMQTSCYDCHSNNSKYPWYANVQPVAWWLNHHIEEGKQEINFNEFATYRLRRQYRKLQEIVDQIKEDEMPMSSYTLIHKNATLSAEQKNIIITWATASMDSMKLKYPIDSLIKKQS